MHGMSGERVIIESQTDATVETSWRHIIEQSATIAKRTKNDEADPRGYRVTT
jgi:hypothetical protein